jgi:hypothetical protein
MPVVGRTGELGKIINNLTKRFFKSLANLSSSNDNRSCSIAPVGQKHATDYQEKSQTR